jgi:hypothetical protein
MTADTAFALTVHHLNFVCEAATYVHFGPQAGAQIRGALWNALEKFACPDPAARHDPQHTRFCPMCRLMALEEISGRGVNPARPLAIRPPLSPRAEHDRRYDPGQQFEIGVNLFGDAGDLFHYVCHAVYQIGADGVGYGRGRFMLRQVTANNPFTGERQTLLGERGLLTIPGCPVVSQQVEAAVSHLPQDRIRLRFLTPTQITHQGRVLSRPDFAAMVARLLERCQSLELHYTSRPAEAEVWRQRHLALAESAALIHLRQDNTRWVSVRSYSRRSGYQDDIGGMVGEVLVEGDLRPFLPWLVWGQSLHVGKHVIKGAGWYELATV